MPNITFDPHGDVKLVLSTSEGASAAHFLVNSGVLCLASPVFRAMLGANSCFKERKDLADNRQNSNNPPLDVPLSDDDPEALAIVLRIIHLHYQWIPTDKNLNQSRIYQIAIICDKYEMKHAILYWFRQWSRSLHEDTSRWSDEAACKWLYIAYAFGDESLFMKMSRELILQSKTDLSGSITVTLEFVPQAVIDEIQAMRKKAVDSMMDMIHVQIHQYSSPNNIQCPVKDTTCDATILGLLMRALHGIKLDLTYVGKAANIAEPRSIIELKELLDKITFPDFLSQHAGRPHLSPGPAFGEPAGFFNKPPNYQCSCCRNGNTLTFGFPTNNIKCVKHTAQCSPLPQFKENLDKLLESIKGLDYSRFVGGTNKDHFAGNGSEDLWNTVGL